MSIRPAATALLLAVALTGCGPKTDDTDVTVDTTPDATTPAPEPATPDFVDRTWKVSASPSVAVGSTYRFHSDGTLTITNPGGTPLTGTWRRDGEGRIIMVEESIEYPTDIVSSSATELRIRSNNPGGAVDITLVPGDSL